MDLVVHDVLEDVVLEDVVLEHFCGKILVLEQDGFFEEQNHGGVE